jgi:hypothetical protein
LGSLLLIGGTIVAFSLDVRGMLVTKASLQAIQDTHGKTPIYMEWDGKTIVLHPAQYRIPVSIKEYRLGDSDLTKVMHYLDLQIERSVFANLLQCLVEKRTEKYLVILVRPSGFKNFLYLREFLLHKGVDLGYEAVGQHWVLSSEGSAC